MVFLSFLLSIGAAAHTKHALVANIDQVVLLILGTLKYQMVKLVTCSFA
jgi:hypothetical protein